MDKISINLKLFFKFMLENIDNQFSGTELANLFLKLI